ncbi:MAG: diaminopimelate decarboxylase [Burkholderiaceae bacterium]|jgi:diaminopimelate decarboxylase|nr:diaminopimelate decarboxylase [Burkholderiaceae bacterium]MEB2320072.1 diaminopimelate decarboxylase [Pseudomonadota bacterium]
MPWYDHRNGELFAEAVRLADIAERYGTPTFVYSASAIRNAYREFAKACAGRRVTICYALKANSNLAVVDLLAREGAGFDIVSAGELRRVLAVGGDPARVVFSGVGKSAAEMREALEAGVGCFNVESDSELERLSEVAQALGRRAAVSLRVNPDVDARTHPYISTGLRQNKFGIAHGRARATYRRAAGLPGIDVVGIDCHIGSQITEIAPFLAAADRVADLVDELRADGIELRHIDLGGGLGVRYRDEDPPSRQALMQAIFERLDSRFEAGRYEIMFEFGRALVGNAGLLLTRVEYIKDTGERRFAIVDAAMNDLIRPSLYDAWHGVVPVRPRAGATLPHDIVGPVCESGDWLARERMLCVEPGDLLAFESAGAYAMVMSSNYNSRGRAAEVMVDGDRAQLVRERESLESLYALERTLK